MQRKGPGTYMKTALMLTKTLTRTGSRPPEAEDSEGKSRSYLAFQQVMDRPFCPAKCKSAPQEG